MPAFSRGSFDVNQHTRKRARIVRAQPCRIEARSARPANCRRTSSLHQHQSNATPNNQSLQRQVTTAGEGGVSSGFVGSGHRLAGTDLQYRALFHSMDQGFCVIEVRFDDASTAVDYRFLEVNAAFEQQTGLRDAQDRWMRELAPNHEDHWFHIYGQVALTGQPVRFENAANALGARWFDVYAFRVGEPSLRRVAILFRDITQRKNTERALRRREAQLQTLFDAAPLGIYVVDDEFRIRAVNPAALPVFAEIADPVGRVLDEVSHALWTREQAPDVVAQFRRTLETGEPYVVAEHRDGSGESSEPTYYEWEIHRIPLPESRFGVVCYFRNITHQVLARQTLSEADRRKNEFIATLSHELRNPLASIHSAAELLHQPNAHEATREWAAAVAQRQTKAMARLLDDLLDVSRLTLGRLEMRKERVALSSVLDSALETARPAIERANHTVSITKPPASVLVDADPLRLSQVFSNLLSNAAKYTAPGGRIALAVEVQPDEVIISVSDNGIGIAPADIGSVFEMFMQTPDARSRSSEGLGIGLALVRGIVELHDGHVIAESEGVGSGSRFTVFLPRAVSGR
jgi:PAS domain S-box-containing protein